jgi:hypothetical protein
MTFTLGKSLTCHSLPSVPHITVLLYSFKRYRKYSCSPTRKVPNPTHPLNMPLTNPKPIKLNPTTITIPQSSTGSLYPLKLALTPHLLIEDSFGLPSTIKKDGDAVFEVMVPVGGTVEVEIELDRDGLEKVGGADMSISREMELEDLIKDKILSAVKRVCIPFEGIRVNLQGRIPPLWQLRRLGLAIRLLIRYDHLLPMPTGLTPIPLSYRPTNQSHT